MQVFIKGTWITLTQAQIKEIERAEKRKQAALGSFHRVLIAFGFKKLNTKDWADPNTNAYEHSYYNWYAEIQTHAHFEEVWMTGQGLMNSSFPGGWLYGSPEQVKEALDEALEKLNKTTKQ